MGWGGRCIGRCSASRDSAALRPGHEGEVFAHSCLNVVFASATTCPPGLGEGGSNPAFSAEILRSHLHADTRFQPRGSFARALRRCLTPNEEGRREDRVPAGHPRSTVRKRVLYKIAQRHTGEAKRPAFPAQWFDGLCRALPGERCTIAPVALPIPDARTRLGRHITTRLDASLRAPGPHGFAVRNSHRSYTRGILLTAVRPAKPFAPM